MARCLSMFSEKMAQWGWQNMAAFPRSHIQHGLSPLSPYCSCCVGTTGYIFPCCSGMCLIQWQPSCFCLPEQDCEEPCGVLSDCLSLSSESPIYLFIFCHRWNAWKMQPSCVLRRSVILILVHYLLVYYRTVLTCASCGCLMGFPLNHHLPLPPPLHRTRF